MEQGRATRGSTKIPREGKKKHEAGEIKRIRGLLKSGPRPLSVHYVSPARYTPRRQILHGAVPPRAAATETRYLRLIGNGASLIRDIISSGKLPSLVAGRPFEGGNGGGAGKKRLPLSRYAADKTSGTLTSTTVPRFDIATRNDAASSSTRWNGEEAFR